MKKRLFSILLVLAMILAAAVPAAAEAPVDPFEEITAEFIQAKEVEPYEIAVRPSRITGRAVLRWAPSHYAPILATYGAKQILTVLNETPNWLMVEDMETGKIGYICRHNVTEPEKIENASHTIDLTEVEDGKKNLGVIDINGAFSLQCALPEGYDVEVVSSSADEMYAIIYSEDETKPILRLAVGYDEEYADVDRLNDVDLETLGKLEDTFIEEDPTVEITYGETGLGTRLLIAEKKSSNIDSVTFMSIYKGYFVECVLLPSQTSANKKLTDEEIRMCVDFLTQMDFVPVNEEKEGIMSVLNPGEKYVARISDYSPDDNTAYVEVLEKILLDREQVDGLKIGDSLVIGEDTIAVEALESDEFGVYINGQYVLLYGNGTVVEPSYFGHPYYRVLWADTMEIPLDMTFTDGISEEGGALEEPEVRSVAEFITKLEEFVDGEFDSDNVYVTFTEDGNLASVERFYVLWQ